MGEQTEALEQQILADARSQAEPILRRARRQAEEILRQARQEAERRREDIRRNALERAEAEARRVRARAELEAENIRRAAREEILQYARQQAVEALRSVPGEERYAEMLLELALAGLRAMRGRRFELLMRAEDREAHGAATAGALRDRAASELGRQVIVTLADETVRASGGLVVRRADGHLLCDQTFEARLERLWDELRVEVAKVLFPEALRTRAGGAPAAPEERRA